MLHVLYFSGYRLCRRPLYHIDFFRDGKRYRLANNNTRVPSNMRELYRLFNWNCAKSENSRTHVPLCCAIHFTGKSFYEERKHEKFEWRKGSIGKNGQWFDALISNTCLFPSTIHCTWTEHRASYRWAIWIRSHGHWLLPHDSTKPILSWAEAITSCVNFIY